MGLDSSKIRLDRRGLDQQRLPKQQQRFERPWFGSHLSLLAPSLSCSHDPSCMTTMHDRRVKADHFQRAIHGSSEPPSRPVNRLKRAVAVGACAPARTGPSKQRDRRHQLHTTSRFESSHIPTPQEAAAREAASGHHVQVRERPGKNKRVQAHEGPAGEPGGCGVKHHSIPFWVGAGGLWGLKGGGRGSIVFRHTHTHGHPATQKLT